MKSSNISPMFSRLIVLSLSISLLCVQTMVAFALPAKGGASAEISVTGPSIGGEKAFVLVNGDPAFNGRTFFSDGTISTTETSSATVNLGRLGRVELAPSSSLSLSFSEGRIAGMLSKGNATISSVDGVSVKIDTPSDSVTNEGAGSSRFAVNVLGDHTSVAVQNGAVRYRNGGEVLAQQDDDDDDDEWKGWATAGVIAGAIGAVILIIVLNDDDEDDVVSPSR